MTLDGTAQTPHSAARRGNGRSVNEHWEFQWPPTVSWPLSQQWFIDKFDRNHGKDATVLTTTYMVNSSLSKYVGLSLSQIFKLQDWASEYDNTYAIFDRLFNRSSRWSSIGCFLVIVHTSWYDCHVDSHPFVSAVHGDIHWKVNVKSIASKYPWKNQ